MACPRDSNRRLGAVGGRGFEGVQGDPHPGAQGVLRRRQRPHQREHSHHCHDFEAVRQRPGDRRPARPDPILRRDLQVHPGHQGRACRGRQGPGLLSAGLQAGFLQRRRQDPPVAGGQGPAGEGAVRPPERRQVPALAPAPLAAGHGVQGLHAEAVGPPPGRLCEFGAGPQEAGQLLRVEQQRTVAGLWLHGRLREDLRPAGHAGDGGVAGTQQRGVQSGLAPRPREPAAVRGL
mmetsp:Transcript_29304/g.40269  ORF Transcript_29304/g.40269 Transcript_29304/m.40269 type:complete len:234 (-) Transcript_29304:433-1134(-)